MASPPLVLPYAIAGTTDIDHRRNAWPRRWRRHPWMTQLTAASRMSHL
ncbi:hypothetical protein XAR_0327 [Xanthomonas citri pv. glycines str. 8ra]|nr:hypothetical protein XAR_0327 [Xanthomonas citri pv. glycines str. 8ra]